MSIESLAPYSPTTIYGQLTSPFTPKTITINSHTPYDKVDEDVKASEVYGRAFFAGKPQARIAYQDISEYKPLYEDFPPDISEIKKKQPNVSKDTSSNQTTDTTKTGTELSSFSVSSYSNNNILRGALTHGYTVDESVVIQNAYNAYQRSALITRNAPETLSTCSYRVF